MSKMAWGSFGHVWGMYWISRSDTAIVGFLGEQVTKTIRHKTNSPRARAKLSKGFPFFMEAQ